MASITVPYVGTKARVESGTGVPWTIQAGVLGVTSSTLGLAWDISWHRSIGRDTFWTPAHMMIYACGAIAAVVCGYLIFSATFGKAPLLRAQSVSVLGFRAPLGAFIAAWGGLAMLVSGPFDNWWHAAYGLDITILSPPHTLLLLGLNTIAFGVLFLILAAMNRALTPDAAELAGNSFAAMGASLKARGAQYERLQKVFLYMGGLMVISQMTYIMEFTWDVKLHSVSAYMAVAVALPVALAVIKRASGARWACTIVAGIYMVFIMAEVWLFPLVPATPKLGPVLNPVTHLIPLKFPILVVLPALAMDLLWNRLAAWKPWKLAALSGVVFVAVLVVVEWPFALFLLSKASENRFFGTIYFDYSAPSYGVDRMRRWFMPDGGLALLKGLFGACVAAMASVWAGLKIGNWMREVQR